MITGVVNTKSFIPSGYRFDPDIHLSEGVQVRREIAALPYEISNVGENAERVFYGNIFSRIFVKKPVTMFAIGNANEPIGNGP